MSKRFFPLSEPREGSRFANLAERLNAPLPGEPMYAEGDYEAPRGSTSSRLQAYRDKQAGTSPVAMKPKATTAPKPTVAAPATLTPAQAAEKAAEAAKARHATVMASAAVKGREKQAAELLLASCKTGSKFAKAETIIAQLGQLPLDAQLAAVDKHLRSKAAQQVWDKAAAKVAAERGKPSPQSAVAQPAKAKESVWDKAWARIEGAKA